MIDYMFPTQKNRDKITAITINSSKKDKIFIISIRRGQMEVGLYNSSHFDGYDLFEIMSNDLDVT